MYEGEGGRGIWWNVRSFDARALLGSHGEELDVGEHRLVAVHLSQRGVFDADGYYHCVANRPLP
jgi:activating signal cointegrator complex subunit 1